MAQNVLNNGNAKSIKSQKDIDEGRPVRTRLTMSMVTWQSVIEQLNRLPQQNCRWSRQKDGGKAAGEVGT